MTEAELEAALKDAFSQCEVVGRPLDGQQKAILLRVIANIIREDVNGARMAIADATNPLDEMTQAQRQALLEFVQEQATQNGSWKVQLLNDWLENRDSGAVQFVRERYGLTWLERVQPIHLAQYADINTLLLQVGDRIEVSNSLWEWVQEDGPCSREWFPCTVIAITETGEDAEDATLPSLDNTAALSCTIRFENGMEYEIQGIYDWNRYNWRWANS